MTAEVAAETTDRSAVARARLREIQDEFEIEQVLISFVNTSDRWDAEGVAESFYPGTHYEHGVVFDGTVEEFLAWGMDPSRANAASAMTHPLTNVRIEINGSIAAAQSYCVANFLKRGAGGESLVIWWGGRFLDRLERREGKWKIARRRVIIDWNLGVPYQQAYPEGLFTLGQRSTDDESYELFASVREGRAWRSKG